MLLRVDDFPHGGQQGADHAAIIEWYKRFRDIVDVPFALAYVPTAVNNDILASIVNDSNVTLACHGLNHVWGEFDEDVDNRVAAGRMMHGLFPSVYIPPFNWLSQKLVNSLGFSGYNVVASGPETDQAISYRDMRHVASTWYGKSVDIVDSIRPVGGIDSCLTIHLTWERVCADSLKLLVDKIRSSIVGWGGLSRPVKIDNPAVKSIQSHIPQKAFYQWLFDRVDFRGKRVLDFGPGGYPLPSLIALSGGNTTFVDREPSILRTQERFNKQYGVKTESAILPSDEALASFNGAFDIITASNSLQHNVSPDAPWGMISRTLSPTGIVCISEKAGPVSKWDTSRNDPCWVRSVDDHVALWKTYGFEPAAIAFFQYSWNESPAKETAAWCSKQLASEVCAILRRV